MKADSYLQIFLCIRQLFQYGVSNILQGCYTFANGSLAEVNPSPLEMTTENVHCAHADVHTGFETSTSSVCARVC